jgi:uncharacterized protein YeaO (DUF488 family)
MLARYKIYRGKRPANDPLPHGIRQDTRKHTRHCLRPPAALVRQFLTNTTNEGWHEFAERYRQALEKRFEEDRSPFDGLAELASANDVFLGCSCPTQNNPDVRHCHTVVALRFMKKRYPKLAVQYPT